MTSRTPLGATTIRTALSRTVIDVNRDPSGAVAVSRTDHHRPLPHRDLRRRAAVPAPAREPDAAEIERRRRRRTSSPITQALQRTDRAAACDSMPRWCCTTRIPSAPQVPRLFEGELPQFNIGTEQRRDLRRRAHGRGREDLRRRRGYSRVTNGRFRGGWITRHYGKPENGIHAIQMELSMRGYLHEPAIRDEKSWPAPLDDELAATLARARCAMYFAHASASPRMPEPPNDPNRQESRLARAAPAPRLSAKSWLTEAPLRMLHEQSRPGRGRAPGGTGGVWRHRPRRARLGKLRCASSPR